MENHVAQVFKAIEESGQQFIAIRANNDIGSDLINTRLNLLNRSDWIKVFPSLRFEYYLTLLKHARFIIGNSSSGVREAPAYGVPCLNLGSRQFNRNHTQAVINVAENSAQILSAIQGLPRRFDPVATYGDGKAAGRFLNLLTGDEIWSLPTQKTFYDRGHAAS